MSKDIGVYRFDDTLHTREGISKKSMFKKCIRVVVNVCIYAGIIAFFIIGFSVELGLTSGPSMKPTIDGDLIVIEKWGRYLGKENAGVDFYDVVNLRDLEVNGKTIKAVKRAIGLPGDLIEIKNGVVFRNGEEIDDSIIVHQDTVTNLTTKVSEGHIFVLGDNRTNSLDSRYFGEIPLEKVNGVINHTFDVSWLQKLSKN